MRSFTVAEQKIKKIVDESVPLTFVRVLINPYLRTTALRCIASIFRNFFFLQHRAAFLPGLIPVSKVDHPLDKKIPFNPGKVSIYLDFVAFWIRCISFLRRAFGREALEPLKSFLESMGNLYETAAEVYRKNLSTTERPFYIKHPRFLAIHILDPHLMCIPSLHVMVVIRTYTFFSETIKAFGEENKFKAQVEELFLGAKAITEAVLYVKQHSVNCIPAALYAMTRFDSGLFPPDEAGRFVSCLFDDSGDPGAELSNPTGEVSGAAAVEIRNHINSLYHRFLAQGGDDWTAPLLDFLKERY